MVNHHFLEACIKSCVNQTSVTTKQSKVILYTSTTNDDIKLLCQEYKLELHSKTGGGIGIDWNNALSFVTTKYATIAHQYDIYLPGYGTAILSAFEKSEDMNLVFTDYCENDANNQLHPRNLNLKIKTIGLKLMSLFQIKTYQRRVYALGNFICCPAVSYNLERLVDFQFDENLKIREVRILYRKGYNNERFFYDSIFVNALKNTTGMWHKTIENKKWYTYLHRQKIY